MRLIQKIFFGNYILFVTVLSWLSAQVCKTILYFFSHKKLCLERLYGAGGMPSAHSSFVSSAVVASGKLLGMSSPVFALAFVVATVVMYDAMGVRRSAGRHAQILNRLDEKMRSDNDGDNLFNDDKKLQEQLGHTPWQVVAGAALGAGIAFLVPVFG